MLLSLPALLFATTGTTPRRAFYLGMLHGMIGYGFALSWLSNIFGVGALVLFEILGLFTAVLCLWLNSLARRVRSGHLFVLLAATIWTGVEFYRSELFDLRFPWITPGTALGPTFLSPIVGVYGTTFLVVAASAGFLHRRTMLAGVVLTLVVLVLGTVRPGRIEPRSPDSVSVALIQDESRNLQSCLQMTRATAGDGDAPDLVIWPEYTVPYDVRQNPHDFAQVHELCAEINAVLIVGTQTKVGAGGAEWRNTALVIGPAGVIGEYYKARPVHFFNDGIPGRDFEPIDSDIGAIGSPICFDCDYTDVTRSMAARGAEFFAVPSCDPATWSAKQHLQHAQLFRLRAAENGRWLACAASSGVSQIIDPRGHVHASLPPLETGVLTGTIDRNRETTFFARAGWLFPWLTIVIAGAELAIAGFRSLLSRRAELNRVRRDCGVVNNSE